MRWWLVMNIEKSQETKTNYLIGQYAIHFLAVNYGQPIQANNLIVSQSETAMQTKYFLLTHNSRAYRGRYMVSLTNQTYSGLMIVGCCTVPPRCTAS